MSIDRWNCELRETGYRDPARAVPLERTLPGSIDRDAVADRVISLLGAKRSAWNVADIRGKAEVLLAQARWSSTPPPGSSGRRTSPSGPSRAAPRC